MSSDGKPMSRAERRRAEKLARKKPAGKPGLPNIPLMLDNAQKDIQAGRVKQAVATLEHVLKHQPSRDDVRMAAAAMSIDLSNFDNAAEHYAELVKTDANNVKAQFGLALSLKSLGRFGEAVAPTRAAVQLSNKAVEPVRMLIQLLWAVGDTADIPDLSRTLLEQEPYNVEAAMYEGMAYYHMGEDEKARAVFGYDDLVEVHALEPPAGYDDIHAFNQALAAHIVDHPTMAVPDKDHPTYHTKELHITRELIGPNAKDDGGAVKELEALIAAKVDDYLARKKETLGHPFFKRWPKKSRLTAWGTLLKGKGNLVSHIHPDGYLGMVYYPDLPDEMRSEAANAGEDTRGFLELGHPPDDFPVSVKTDTYTIQPKDGRLVIFPGYFFHRTVPFESNDRRISIAFDVVAEK